MRIGYPLPYFDTQKQKYRTAIPDFYLPETNTIVEIKSGWAYDEINMKDKIVAYKNKNYLFKLILDKKEQDIIYPIRQDSVSPHCH